DGQALADRLAVALMASVADVGRAGGPVVRPHPAATAAADHQPLEYATTPTGRTTAGLELRAVVLERRADGEMAVPRDVGRMGIELDRAVATRHVPGGQTERQLAAAGLAQASPLQELLDAMQLHLADRAAQTQQQPVVEQARLIDAGVVRDQRAGQGGQLQEP